MVKMINESSDILKKTRLIMILLLSFMMVACSNNTKESSTLEPKQEAKEEKKNNSGANQEKKQEAKKLWTAYVPLTPTDIEVQEMNKKNVKHFVIDTSTNDTYKTERYYYQLPVGKYEIEGENVVLSVFTDENTVSHANRKDKKTLRFLQHEKKVLEIQEGDYEVISGGVNVGVFASKLDM